MTEKEKTLRLILRSVYLTGMQDGKFNTADVISWEDKVVKQINRLYLPERKEMVR